tara:strand:- start:62526 stop:62711 length:186 start_codon:yes stop_codon:yes gene_type:complete
MKLETKQKIKFILMIVSILLGYLLMLIRIEDEILMKIIIIKLSGIVLLFLGLRLVESFFKI